MLAILEVDASCFNIKHQNNDILEYTITVHVSPDKIKLIRFE